MPGIISAPIKTETDMDVQGEESEAKNPFPEEVFGTPHPGYGKWASCIRLLDIGQNSVCSECVAQAVDFIVSFFD